MIWYCTSCERHKIAIQLLETDSVRSAIRTFHSYNFIAFITTNFYIFSKSKKQIDHK